MTAPVTLEDIKVHLRLDAADGPEDDLLQALIDAAARACEHRINRPISDDPDPVIFTLDGFPRPSLAAVDVYRRQRHAVIEIPALVGMVSSVDYIDDSGATVALDGASWSADVSRCPARLFPVSSWPCSPWRPGGVSIEYIPAPMSADDLIICSQAIRLLVGGWYIHRESVAVDVRGIPVEIPNSVKWLLDPLRVIAFRAFDEGGSWRS